MADTASGNARLDVWLDYGSLLLLSAVWGSSFLFMRIASPVFGPTVLIFLRVGSALLFLLPVCLYLGKHREALQHGPRIMLLSLASMALPFTLLAYATLTLSAGFAAILNSTVPFFTVLVGFLYWSQRLPLAALLGLLVGFGGVVVLVFDPDSSTPGGENLLAVAAGLGSSLLYAIAANYTAHRMQGVSGLSLTVGSLFSATLFMAPLAWLGRPEELPSGSIWLAVLALGVLCTGVAYLLFYRLIRRIGSYQAVTATFLVPLFSIVWGALFLGEAISLLMVLGSSLVLLGVALATGRFSLLRVAKSAA